MAFDYTKYNFQELIEEVQRLLADASSNPAVWKDSYHSSTAQVLIQLIAATTDNLHYMLERRVHETYLPTAKLKSSVDAIVNLLGYRPRRIISSSGTLRLTLNVPAINQIIIEKYEPLTFGGNKYVTKDRKTVLVGQQDIDLDCFEGEVETVEVNTTTGAIISNTSDKIVSYNITDNYLLIKEYSDIENDSFVIYSDDNQEFFDVYKKHPTTGAPPIGAISFADSLDEVFDIRLSNDGLRIHFGDDTFGEKPRGQLTVKWVKSKGPDVILQTYWDTVLLTGTVNNFTFDNHATLLDSTLPIPNSYTYILKNITPIDDGLASETTNQIKLHAPDFIRTGNRAVTKHDFTFWTKNSGVGGIIDASAYGEEELGTNLNYSNNVYIHYLQSNASELTISEKAELKDFLDFYKTITTTVVINPVETIPLDIDVTVTQNPNIALAASQIQDITIRALEELFAIQEGSIGRSAFHSVIVEHLQNYTAIDQTGVEKNIAKNVTITVKAIKILDVTGVDNISTIVPIPVITQPSTPVDFILKGSMELVNNMGVSVPSEGFKRVLFGAGITGTTSTGLSGLTSRTVDITVNGGAPQTITEIDNNLTTFNAVITALNTQLVGAKATIINGQIVIYSLTTGLTSSINISNDNFFTVMASYSGVSASVAGDTKTIDTTIDSNTGYFGGGIINYKTGVLTFPHFVTNGRYYIKYSQNNNQNFDSSVKQILLLDKQVLENDLLAPTILSTVTVV